MGRRQFWPLGFSRPRRKGSALKNLVGALHIEAARNMLPIMSIEEIEAAISRLSPDDLARLAAWIMEFRVAAGDQQLDADVKGGKLDQLARQAKEDPPPKRD